MTKMRIALVHDYLVHVRGGERVFEALAEIYPQADVHTFVYDPLNLPASLRRRHINASFIQRLPYSRRRFRLYMALYPLAAKTTDLRAYDLVISSSSAWAHAVSVARNTTLVCYCHSPFRYIWDRDALLPRQLRLVRPLWGPIRTQLQRLDRRAASRVDFYIANSQAVRRKVGALYGRESSVISPPVDLERFAVSDDSPGDYFLIVSALMRYKRIDIAVQAFKQLGLPLRIVGTGEDESRLRRMATDNISFLGSRTDAELAQLYSRCRALIVTAEEDFGIAPLESMASGRPVIAYKAGGVLETVDDGVTGLFYPNQTAESLVDIISTADLAGFDRTTIRRHVEKFGKAAFQERLHNEVNRHLVNKMSRSNLRTPGGIRPAID